MILSITEENYIKAIYHLSGEGDEAIGTNEIAAQVNARAASVSDMLKKLKRKKLITYQKYYGVRLTPEGNRIAAAIVRKHRLWEVFLVEKLGYSWDKIHDIAEQLEHIRSEELIERLDKFLGYPKFDPHGDPIPDSKGKVNALKHKLLASLRKGDKARVTGVKDSSAKLLQHLSSIGIQLGTTLEVHDVAEFDGSMLLRIDGKKNITVSRLVAENILCA
ncbi:MAG: metal-dependent transcriptional regulator [Chitinophagales bacterium]|nr:metal-dependent transcriptional regulator [Chitinophagales bacterium]MDW8419799.1 metal-dependent transcriptional regulator [Chitinophagales bacterium]